jgi:hypothetical protein
MINRFDTLEVRLVFRFDKLEERLETRVSKSKEEKVANGIGMFFLFNS